MSCKRNRDYNTVHHLTSRIAHQVFFLKEEERNDFMDLVVRVSAFSGVELIGWCIMDNHFHLYVYLPEPPILSDAEVWARRAALKGDKDRIFADDWIEEEKRPGSQVGGAGLSPVERLRRRMYSIPEYMKMIKQWFTEDYNARHDHKGTMWEATYRDRTSPYPESDFKDVRDTLAYAHLNPIRAAITDQFSGYAWSSYTAYRNGDALAAKGMHLAYPGMTDEEIVATHEMRMSRLLEDEKRKRAEQIARKRLAGYQLPCDPLTDEAMVAQMMERTKRVQQMVVEMQAEREIATGAKARRELAFRQIMCEMTTCPDATTQFLATALDLPLRTVQRYVERLVKEGEVRQIDGRWMVKVGAEGQTFDAKLRRVA